MKTKSKFLILLGALSLGLAVPSVQAHGDHSAGGNTPEARANRLEEALGLTEEQAKKIEAIYTEEAAALKTLRDKKLDPKVQREEIKTVRAAYLVKVKAVLTPEQVTKLETQQKEREKAREAAGAAEGKDAKGAKEAK